MTERSTILVTGGAGYVGSHFVRAARERGRRVVVIDDLSGGATTSMPPGASLIVGDVGAGPFVRRVMVDFEVGAVVHFAGKRRGGNSAHGPEEYFDVNLVRTLTLLESARAEGVGAFLYSSTAAVYGAPERVPIAEDDRREPVDPYGACKLAVEHALRAWGQAHGLRWAALRRFNAAGAHPDGSLRETHDPETHLIPLVVDAGLGRGRPVCVFGTDYDTPDGTCIRDYVHVMDLAVAHLDALDALENGRLLGALNLGTGRGHSVRQVILAAGEVLGRPIPHVAAARRPGDQPTLIADPARAATEIGWTAERSALPTIIEDTLRSRR